MTLVVVVSVETTTGLKSVVETMTVTVDGSGGGAVTVVTSRRGAPARGTAECALVAPPPRNMIEKTTQSAIRTPSGHSLGLAWVVAVTCVSVPEKFALTGSTRPDDPASLAVRLQDGET
jgi:hypothetical protein